MISNSQSSEHFEKKYIVNDDPWQYASNQYELQKYNQAIQTLPREKYTSALELGCSIGVMTELIAKKCIHLLAIDCAPSALTLARQRCAQLPHVHVKQAAVPREFPDGLFDLITFCELGYYLSERDLAELYNKIAQALMRGGHLLMVHWKGKIEDGPLTATLVHTMIKSDQRFKRIACVTHPEYLLDLFELQ